MTGDDLTVNSAILAPYATRVEDSRGRLVKEKPCNTRSPYQRDRDRIVHSAAFRRLEYKTQVFINHEGDHYRTRLTHSLEVAQLSRSLCRALHLNEDIGEAVALAHDLGHTPFGHAGEEGLQAVMAPYGGFDHNAQAIRILTRLEQRYARFDGLNLSWETLEGVAKHNGPLLTEQNTILPWAMEDYSQTNDLELESFAGAEAQIAALSDDIAYNNHDLEDGVRAHMFSLNDIRHIPLMEKIITTVDKKFSSIDEQRRVHEVVRRVINHMVTDVLTQTRENIALADIRHVKDVRALGKPLVHFSPLMQQNHLALKAFLMETMYRHYRVNRMSSKAKRVVGELFTFFYHEPDCLPTSWRMGLATMNDTQRARHVSDFIAGMTDRFAVAEHERVYNVWR